MRLRGRRDGELERGERGDRLEQLGQLPLGEHPLEVGRELGVRREHHLRQVAHAAPREGRLRLRAHVRQVAQLGAVEEAAW